MIVPAPLSCFTHIDFTLINKRKEVAVGKKANLSK